MTQIDLRYSWNESEYNNCKTLYDEMIILDVWLDLHTYFPLVDA